MEEQILGEPSGSFAGLLSLHFLPPELHCTVVRGIFERPLAESGLLRLAKSDRAVSLVAFHVQLHSSCWLTYLLFPNPLPFVIQL